MTCNMAFTQTRCGIAYALWQRAVTSVKCLAGSEVLLYTDRHIAFHYYGAT